MPDSPESSGPPAITGRYSTEHGYTPPNSHVCLDCGSLVWDRVTHDRSHAIQGDVGRSLAMIVNAHITPAAHALFNVYEKISKGRNRNNWSGEALDEVTGNITSITQTEEP
jgi:hypothetical protein